MTDCQNCNSYKWKEMYTIAQQRFDKVVARLTIGVFIMVAVLILCLFATIFMCIKTQRFINDFEYVEETELMISQDSEGINTAIVGNGNGVGIYGTGNNTDKKEILEKKGTGKKGDTLSED